MSSLRLVLFLSLITLVACAESAPPMLGGSDAGAATLEGGAVGPNSCAMAGALQACTCPNDLSGSQRCLGEQWGDCVCVGAPAVMDDMPPPSGMNACKAGYYTGSFEGEYWSGVFDPGAAFGVTLGSLIPVPVRAVGQVGKPGLALTLEEQLAEAGEGIVTLAVKDGCVVGTADAFGTQHPFVGALKGELDCDTGVFEGTLRGNYQLFGTDLIFDFEGPVSAQYQDMRLTDGVWDVREDVTADNSPGGSGPWEATWMSELSEAPPPPEECMELLNGGSPGADESTSADAGVGAGG